MESASDIALEQAASQANAIAAVLQATTPVIGINGTYFHEAVLALNLLRSGRAAVQLLVAQTSEEDLAHLKLALLMLADPKEAFTYKEVKLPEAEFFAVTVRMTTMA